jgi:hypothetical protein
VKLDSRLSILLLAFSILAAGQGAPSLDSPRTANPIQRLVCNTGYKISECQQQLGVLRAALAPYPSHRLGTWTWVLVKSQDWKPIVQRMGGNADSPAFSVMEKRETFLEEALFVPVGSRQVELLRIWSIPVDKFLDVAITHELGHGICHDLSEARADVFSRLLREHKEPECDTAHR